MKKALLALCLLLAPAAVMAQDTAPKVQVRLVALLPPAVVLMVQGVEVEVVGIMMAIGVVPEALV